jgi:hypothetical protein
MTQKENELLLVDLCARIPYGLIVRQEGSIYNANIVSIDVKEKDAILQFHSIDKMRLRIDIAYIKHYLRPMSSMTEEEKIESLEFAWEDDYGRLASYNENIPKYIDWLNKHHFDYRGLIEKGLAIEALEGMYNNIKEQ